MEQFFSKDYAGGAFQLFGTAHLVGLGFILSVCGGLYFLRKRFNPTTQKITRFSLWILIYLCEASWHIWKLANHDWTIQAMLPLWLCSLTAWTIPLLLVFHSQRYYEWVYFMGIIGASQALLTPDLMNYGFPHFRFIEFITLHGLIIVAIIYMTVVEGFRPHWRSIPYTIFITNIYWILCGIINPLIGGNYLYTQGKLPTPSLLDYLGPWPWYLLVMEILGIGLCLLLYLPFALKDHFSGSKTGRRM